MDIVRVPTGVVNSPVIRRSLA